MKLGAVLVANSGAQGPGGLPRLAQQLEREGYDSLWVAQATGRGFFLPDPFVALAAACAATERIQLGSAIIQVPLYPPAALAHSIFSLMQIAGDRLRIGVGAGSTESDFAVFARSYAGRFADFGQGMSELRHMLETGQSIDASIDLSPDDQLKGGPPLLLGTWGKGVATAARDYSGWIASAMYRSSDQLEASLGTYRQDGGRHAIVSTIALGPEEPAGSHRAKLERFEAAGFDEAVVLLRPGGPSSLEVRRWVA